MGLVYAPNQPIGKGATSGNIRNFKPRFHGSGGRFGSVIQGAFQVGKFLWKNRRVIQGPSIVGAGAGLSAGSTGLPLDETYYPIPKKNKTNQSFKPRYERGYGSQSYRREKRCWCNVTRRRSSGKYRKSYLPRTMGSRRRLGVLEPF